MKLKLLKRLHHEYFAHRRLLGARPVSISTFVYASMRHETHNMTEHTSFQLKEAPIMQ